MSDNTFEIVFHGVLVPGVDPAQVKRNFAALFKTEAAKVEPLFSGKRFVIKKGLDQATALKYQKALREAGAVVHVEDAAVAARDALQSSLDQSAPVAPRPAAPAPVAAPASQPASASVPAEPVAGNFTIDPPGVILVAPEKVAPLRVETSHLVLDQPGVTLVAPSQVAPLQVDLSAMTLAEPGVVLRTPEPVPDLKVDTGAMTMAAPGVVLVEPEKVAPAVIDTSRIQLA